MSLSNVINRVAAIVAAVVAAALIIFIAVAAVAAAAAITVGVLLFAVLLQLVPHVGLFSWAGLHVDMNLLYGGTGQKGNEQDNANGSG